MNAADLVAALDLPTASLVNQRVSKKLLIENAAPTAVDKRRINEGLEDLYWLAALKPTTIGVPEFRDATREYLEVAVLRADLRPGAESQRLAELVHRAIPYPVLLISAQAQAATISLCHVRWSQGEADATVLDGQMVVADVGLEPHDEMRQPFVKALSLTAQPRADLFALYQGWMDSVVALLAARLTGRFALLASTDSLAARRRALADCAALETRMAGLKAAAARERQAAKQVTLNLELKRLQADHAAARANL